MRSAMRCCGLVVLAAVSSGLGVGVAAAQGMGGMSGHGMTVTTVSLAPEKLPVPVKMEGLGNSELTITTAKPEAQMWFTQGLNLLHDFWDFESSKAFEQSVRVDPQCAMCWWGLAQAEGFRGGNDDWAKGALMQASKLKKKASKWEQLYIKAAEEGAKKGKPKSGAMAEGAAQRDSKETKIWRKLVGMRPEDLQAKIFLTESLRDGFDKAGKPHAGTLEGDTILAAILVAHPEDSAVNHYWIHAQEPGQHPEAALESARKLGRLSPASAHMVHMPGHIFYRTGDYETARLSFAKSMEVDEAYMVGNGVAVDDDWNYVHNMQYLIADLLEAGRIAEATATSAKLNTAHGVRGSALYQSNVRDGLTRLTEELPVLLRGADWKAATVALEKSAPVAEMANLVGLKASMLEYTKGMLALETGDVAAAAMHRDALAERLSAKAAFMPAMKMAGMSMSPKATADVNTAGAGTKDAKAGPVHSYLDVASLELNACVLLAQGKTADADAAFAKATAAEAALGYREPPYYIRPVGETRGDALMRAKRYVEAKKAYEAALVDRPNSGYPLYGMAQADVALGDKAAATADYGSLIKAWSHADEGMMQVVAAKAWVGER